MKTNQKQVVMQSVIGAIHSPTMKNPGYYVGYDGIGRICVGVGGITYNFTLGDSCMEVAGDHVEPGVSLKNSNDGENNALLTLSCVGNQAVVVSGEAKGAIGTVSGKHGGIDHVMIHFDQEILEKMVIGDRIQIKAYGQGFKLLDYPQIQCMNLDPTLFSKLPYQEKEGKLYFPVTHIIPAYMMGAGIGETTMMSGDYDIMTQDREAMKAYSLETLKFGDFIYIQDQECTHGPHYRKNSGTVGIITHSDSFTAGHGPGVTVLMTSHDDSLQPMIDENANLIHYLNH